MGAVEVMVPISLFAMVGWIVFVAVSNGRRMKQVQAMADFHAKVLEKMGSTKDFGEFLETSGGKKFMSSLTVEGPSTKTRIIKSMESGVVALCVGIGFLMLGRWYPDEGNGLTIVGTVIAACGIGFLISCASSFALSKSFGLFDSSNDQK